GKHVDVNERGEPVNGDTLLILFNGDQKLDIPFVLPKFDGSTQWQRLLDSSDPKAEDSLFNVGDKYPLRACSVAILRVLGPEAQPIPVKPAEVLAASAAANPPAPATATETQTKQPQLADNPPPA